MCMTRAQSLVAGLKAYKSDKKKHPLRRLVRELYDSEDIDALEHSAGTKRYMQIFKVESKKRKRGTAVAAQE